MLTRTRTALFDLDGTLLPVEMDFFLKHYMDTLSESFAGVMPREAFDNALLGATYETIDNLDPATGNLDAFAEAFTRRSGLDWDSVWPTIRKYYAERYPMLRKHIPGNAPARAVVRECVDRGWRVVLATQPLFPEVAVRERMRWCDIEDMPWHLVTTLENMHFCKPHTQYYREIVDTAGLEPSQCVMIGNDMQDDMSAKKIGMKTFLVEDFLIDKADSGKDTIPDGRGRLLDVPAGIDRIVPR